MHSIVTARGWTRACVFGLQTVYMYNKLLLFRFALTYVLALLTAPVTTQTLEEGRLHVQALFRPLEGSYRCVLRMGPSVARFRIT